MMKFPHRYIAQIVVEANTPIAIGSDSLQYDQDSPVDKDFNNLPYIPGTTIAGYLKKQLPEQLISLFGTDPDKMTDEPDGSNIIVSDAFLLDNKMKVLQQPTKITCEFLKRYFKLPIRQHTAINEFGSAKEHSKFDTEIVFKGSRFKFEIELQVENKKSDDWKTILNTFFQNNFYLGAGEFNNFGELQVIEIKERAFDISPEGDLDAYLDHTVDLNDKIDDSNFSDYKKEIDTSFYKTKEEITLSGKDSFFHFGAGFGDDEVNNVNYTEFVLDWDSDKSKPEYPFVEKYVIPGTSIKGTLAHRVAFHYNKKNNGFVEDLIPSFKELLTNNFENKYKLSDFKLKDSIEELEKQKTQLEKQLKALDKEKLNTEILFCDAIGTKNNGVTTLFGTAKDSNNETGKSGNIIVKDIYLDKKNTSETIFYHNKIDRYTGGTIESVLYSEKVLAIDKVTLCIKYKEGTNLNYLELALNDLKKGMLPLGGLVNKGHGIFVEL